MSEATEGQTAFAEALDNSLDAALSELQATADEDAALLATADAEESATEDPETPETPAERPKVEKGQLPSYADVVRQVEEALGPEAAEVVKRTQQEGSRQTNQFKAYKRQVDELIQEVQQLKESKSPPAEPDEDDQTLQQLSQRDRKIMDAYLRKMGFVRREEIQAEKQTEQSSDFVRQATEQAVARFGERFARQEDGQFVFDADTQGRMADVMQRLEDDTRGVTPYDLYVLAHLDQLLQEAEERGKAVVKPAVPKANGAPPRERGIVTARSTGGRPNTNVIYRRGKDHPVKDWDSVLDKAVALSRQEMRERL